MRTTRYVVIFISLITAATKIAQGQTDNDIEKQIKTTSVEVFKLANDHKPAQALELLESQLEKLKDSNVDLIGLHSLRSVIASHLAADNDIVSAIRQQEMAAEEWIQLLRDPARRNRFAGEEIEQLAHYYCEAGRTADAANLVKQTISELTQYDNGDKISPITRTFAFFLQNASDPEFGVDSNMVVDAIGQQLERVERHFSADADNEEVIIVKTELLYAAAKAQAHAGNESTEFRERQIQFITEEFERNLQSVEIGQCFGRSVHEYVRTLSANNPEFAKAELDKYTEILDQSNAINNNSLSHYSKYFSDLKNDVNAALGINSMVGKPAPPFQIDAWVNNESKLTLDSMKGKVILLDFWSVSCGPCIMSFPELRQLKTDFGERGLEVVGATNYCRYRWNADSEKPEQAADNDVVSSADEQDSLMRFMKSRELNFPSIVMPKGSDMAAQYGVTGIPHVVLIDRQGIVRSFEIGYSDESSKAVREMIEVLIAE